MEIQKINSVKNSLNKIQNGNLVKENGNFSQNNRYKMNDEYIRLNNLKERTRWEKAKEFFEYITGIY